MRILALVTDAFGSSGGIAKFNRDLLSALCAHPGCDEVVAIPRLMLEPGGPLPPKLSYITSGLNSKWRFALAVVRAAFARPPFSLIFCGHINLVPIGFVAAKLARTPFVTMLHGVEAWQPASNHLTRFLVRFAGSFIAVSETTRQRFLGWATVRNASSYVLPNSIDVSHFGPGQPNPRLLDRYGLRGRKVLLTLGRLSADERYKGVDEVLEILPKLVEKVPNLVYLIVGDGTDRARLEDKARQQGLAGHVVFAGRVSEEEKADHYRVADAFVMAGWGEGFGIVYLEAMACGIPVVASKLDASREAVRDGELGVLVDPKNPVELRDGILAALQKAKGRVPAGLAYFSYANYQRRCHEIIDAICSARLK
ncbi:MAG: glycosyltransferase family 4 protein [Verrucomicrobiia bacterium]